MTNLEKYLLLLFPSREYSNEEVDELRRLSEQFSHRDYSEIFKYMKLGYYPPEE